MLSGALAQVLPFFIGAAALLSIPAVADASVQITQVVYDVEGADTGREWIKITNTGADTVDISGFRLLEAGVHHKLKVVQGGAVLAPDASAIIADNAQNFLLDTPNYSGILFDSSFSLSNSGETLVLKNATGGIEHAYSYTAPVVEKPIPKKVITTKTKQSTAAATSSPAASSRVKLEGNTQSVTAVSPLGNISLGLLAWLAGLGSLIALGVAGVVFVSQEKGRKEETKEEEEKFTIIDN